METIFIVSAVIASLAAVVCKMLLTFSERAHKAEMKLMEEENKFNNESLQYRMGWQNNDLEILTSDRFSSDEKRAVTYKYEKERKRKEQLREQLFPAQINNLARTNANNKTKNK